MSEYTYEFENRNECLEHYEWDNVWWDCADVIGVPRVMYIGDSISCGARKVATQVAEEKLLFDGFGTSKAVDNPHFFAAVRVFASQQNDRCAILFNNGLHGWHLTEEEYGVHYKKIVKFLKEKTNVPLILLLSTDDMIHPGINDRIIERNRIVKAIAEEFSLPVIDLYEVAMAHSDLHTQDKIHFTTEGYTKIAEKIVSYLDENSI